MRATELRNASAIDVGQARTSLKSLIFAATFAFACGEQAGSPEANAGAPSAAAGVPSGGVAAVGGSAVGIGGAGSPSAAAGTSSGTGGASGAGSGGTLPELPDTTGHIVHCVNGYPPHPSDSSPDMLDGPAEFFPPGSNDPNLVDTTVQPQVLQWMTENSWQASHVEWHAIRACNLPGGGGLSKVNICDFKQLVPQDQNCQSPGDGYQFLVFHRHMIQALKQLWPNHSEQFTGFSKFPTSAEDVPPQWRSAWKNWDADALAAGKIGDEIDKPENLARFADEGELGFWLQCNVGQKLMGAGNMPWVGLHFVLHAKWARPGNTRHGVNNTESNIDNYMFWKLHGWIDSVWEKYRLAKGLQPNDKKLRDDLVAQCQEMHTEIAIIQQDLDPDEVVDPNEPLPVESGFFHEKVRPLFQSQKNLCSGCHAETGANAKLRLGGHVSSADIVKGLVDQPSRGGGQFKLVVPGDPDKSWLYLKAAGKAEAAGCQPSSSAQCIPGVMPPSMAGPTLSAEELATLHQWIKDGAAGPP